VKVRGVGAVQPAAVDNLGTGAAHWAEGIPDPLPHHRASGGQRTGSDWWKRKTFPGS